MKMLRLGLIKNTGKFCVLSKMRKAFRKIIFSVEDFYAYEIIRAVSESIILEISGKESNYSSVGEMVNVY